MKRVTYENIVRSMKAADTLHHRAAAELDQDQPGHLGGPQEPGDIGRVIAGALLALDRRIGCLIFGWMEDTRERLEEDETDDDQEEEEEEETNG